MKKSSIRQKIKNLVNRKTKHPSIAHLQKSPIFKRGRQTISRKNNDGSVSVLRLDDSEYFYTITGLYAETWSELNGECNLDKTLVDLANKHKVEVSALQPRLKKFVEKLEKMELIERA